MLNSLIQLGTPRSMRLAAVDVGTNTLRLLIADVNERHEVVQRYSGREMARLGEGLVHTGRLSDVAMERSLKALSQFAEQIRIDVPEHVVVAATSAVREAENGAEFAQRVRDETGLDLQIIGGDAEARLTSLGASAVLTGNANELMIVDIGGGSTEFILINGGQRGPSVSVPLGVVTATERCITGAPAKNRDLYELDDLIREHMATVRQTLGHVGSVRLVATAGTPTTLAAIDQEMVEYNPQKINNYVLPLARVEQLHDQISNLDLAGRRQLIGVEAGREELLVAGCAILLRVMHDFQFGTVVVSDWGLREGLILDLYERMSKSSVS